MNRDIEFTRGDTYSFTFTLKGSSEQLSDAFLTVRKNKDDPNIIFQKSLSNGITDEGLINSTDDYSGDRLYRVRIAPEDTKTISPNTYVYDLEITKNGDVLTPLKGKMKITYDITY